ncbi:hypothetical protein AMELA_G00197420 [Ameiurus melas]|uniref:Secreted protein n=1 Tax=Ameiurus melas TaxID=219545 RepID=A0A7J6A6B3_AMEME|nr:hypothetical protein AMELA_G00197420 [Ameiurus melas]
MLLCVCVCVCVCLSVVVCSASLITHPKAPPPPTGKVIRYPHPCSQSEDHLDSEQPKMDAVAFS